jgi:hypothetical protein
MSGLFQPPPGRDVGELSAHPLGFYLLSLAERRYSIAPAVLKPKVFVIVEFDLIFVTST